MPSIDEARLAFLRDLTGDVVNEARILPGQILPGVGENTTGITLIRPGGRRCYPAFWVRDFVMSLDSGFITVEELKSILILTAGCQSGNDSIGMATGAVVPPFSIPDHVLLNGQPVFFPGTYSAGLDQGGEPFGVRPPFDDQFYFIEMAHFYVGVSGDKDILLTEVNDLRLMDRLHRAFEVPPHDSETEVVLAIPEERGVNFGFFDTVYQTGYLLFSSLLKYRAALCMSRLCDILGDFQGMMRYGRIAERLREAVPAIFGTPSGWLNAATGVCKQHDVWGTAFAIYIEILEGEFRDKALRAIRDAYYDGSMTYRGNVRQILTTENHSETSAWERALPPINTYQNGAYWGTATGWVLYALSQIDEAAFVRMANEYIDELMEGDYRKGEEYGSPWECFHPDGNHHQNPVYMASVTLPFAALRRLLER